jgi:hypothetical protein
MSKRTFFFREILSVLSIKLALLCGLWALFFSHPIDKQLTPTMVGEHLFIPIKGLNHD